MRFPGSIRYAFIQKELPDGSVYASQTKVVALLILGLSLRKGTPSPGYPSRTRIQAFTSVQSSNWHTQWLLRRDGRANSGRLSFDSGRSVE